MRGILKELENLQISTNVEGTVNTSTVLKTDQHVRNKTKIKGNGTDDMYKNLSQDIISEREKHTINKNPEKMYLFSNDVSSQRYHLTEIETPPKQSFFSLPQLNEPSLNNESQTQVNVPGYIKIPLLSLNRKHNVFEKNQTGANMPEIHVFDYQSYQSKNLPNQEHPFPQSLTHKTFVNHHNIINSYLQQLPDEKHFDLFYFNQKYSLHHQQHQPLRDKTPLPLLQIPKENLMPSWPDFEIRLIPPQLIADFKSRLLEKDHKKRQHFENFQQNQLRKLQKEENQAPLQSKQMQLLVLDRKELETGEVKNPKISSSEDELATNSEKR